MAFLVGGSGKQNIFEISVKEGNLVRHTQIFENLLVSFRSISAYWLAHVRLIMFVFGFSRSVRSSRLRNF